MSAAPGPYILVPLLMTDSMLHSSTVAEPSARETVWTSGGTYVAGDERIRIITHRVYVCVKDCSGRTQPPEDDPMYWLEMRSTDRWAMFDDKVSTATQASSTLTVVIRPGEFFNALALYGLDGTHIEITVRDAPGGNVIKHYDEDLYEPFGDWYEWLFSPYRPTTKVFLRDIVPYATAEITITISASGGTVGIGLVAFGDLMSMVRAGVGGAEYGLSIEPIDYSYVREDAFGNTEIKRRYAATDLRCTVNLPKADEDYAAELLIAVRALPVAFIATATPGYDSANVFGLVSGRVVRDKPSTAEIRVKGLV